ncbi:integrase for IS21, orfA [Shigella sonnei]|nr:integrase for IS21, orfA [Shigella sonnei]
MLSREDFYMIKQMRQQGAYIVDIATQIGCSERTVRRYLKYPEPPARKTRHKMVKLKPFMDYIDMRLAENVWNSEVIFAEIKAMGYTGGRSMLRYYIQPKRKMRPSKRTVRFETQPGYQLQHDWGEVEVEVAGQRCKVNFAVNTLGFSRSFHVFAAPKQDAEHTYESLVRAFRYFGGCVKTVLVDNQKAAVLKNNNGKVVFNSGFLLLADHYNFLPRACRPRRARTKGKVERMVKYLKENFFVRYRRFDSFTHVNQQLEQWIADVADKRELRQFKETPEQRFALEQEHLQPLPDTDFDTSYFDIRHVSWDSYIEVGGNRYSVPEALCGQPVSIRISLDDELRIYSNEKLVASHRLCSASSGWQTVPEHHAPLWQQVSQVEHRPLSAYEKGKVERMVKYLKENFFVRYRRFDSFTHVNQQLEQWIADVADKRELRQFKETPEQRFALEQEHLQPLPDTDFDTSYFDIRHVSWDSYIEVGGNRYSVPEALCGQPVSIRISLDDELRIYSNEKLVASHRLCSASSGWQTVPEHHAPLWQQVSQVEHRPLSAYEELL